MKNQKQEKNDLDKMHEEFRKDMIALIDTWKDKGMACPQALYCALSVSLELIIGSAPDKVELLAMIGTALAQEASHYQDIKDDFCEYCEKTKKKRNKKCE